VESNCDVCQDYLELSRYDSLEAVIEQARLIDAVTDTFYCWCSWEHPELVTLASGDSFYYSRYEKVESEVRRFLGQEAAQLWAYLLNGRPVGRLESSYPYFPSEPGYPNGYWTDDETAFLYGQLERCRDSRKTTVRAAFWNTFSYENCDAIETLYEALSNVVAEGCGLLTIVS
jgi:hypothetical protein